MDLSINDLNSIPIEKFFNHLQRHPLFIIQSSSISIIITPFLRLHLLRHLLHRRLRLRHHCRCNLGSSKILPFELNHHDPIGIRARPCSLLPHSDVRVLSVEPQARQRRRRRLTAFPKLRTEGFRERRRRRR